MELHHDSLPLEKDLTSNPEVLETQGFFPQHL